MLLDDLDILDSGEEGVNEYDGLNEPILTNKDNGQSKVIQYPPANIFVSDWHEEDMAREKIESVITRLAKKFQEKRFRIMKAAYKTRFSYGHLIAVPGAEDDFLNNEEDERSPFPNRRYFIEKMLPTLELMAKGDPRALEQIGNDAIQCLEHILYNGGRSNAFRGLVRNFFEPCYPEDLDENGVLHTLSHHGSEKTFQYLYEKYGRLMAIAAAEFQGTICDEHYDGMDYSGACGN